MRKYEDGLGRFTTCDPLFEKYYGWSPYVYSANNPVSFYDDNGNSLEIDLLGETNDACYIVEIKSHLREEVFEQLEQAIKNFKKFDKKYAEKQIDRKQQRILL